MVRGAEGAEGVKNEERRTKNGGSEERRMKNEECSQRVPTANFTLLSSLFTLHHIPKLIRLATLFTLHSSLFTLHFSLFTQNALPSLSFSSYSFPLAAAGGWHMDGEYPLALLCLPLLAGGQ